MIRIALITSWFPPLRGVAVNRMKSFAKYLSENKDFQIDVFSIGVENQIIILNENCKNYQIKNKSIIDYFKANTNDSYFKHNLKTVIRIVIARFDKNRYRNWKIGTLKKLEENHSEIPYDVIISSYAPEDAHEIALNFVKKFRIHWIADMRDEMSKNPNLNDLTKFKLRNLEKEINEFAHCITTVSKPILKDFQALCPNISIFKEIRNGIDHELQINDWIFPEDKILKIGYFGTFYGDIKPDVFFKSILSILNKIPFQIEFHFYGVHQNFWIPEELKNRIKIFSSVNYEESILKMAQMDANLLILPKGERKGVYSGKIFDYISAKRPILAFVDKEDVAANLILETNSGYIIDFNNIAEGENAILTWIQDTQNNVCKCANSFQIKSLHRKNQIKLLEETILQMV